MRKDVPDAKGNCSWMAGKSALGIFNPVDTLWPTNFFFVLLLLTKLFFYFVS
jgi:hypothetical protein